MGKCCTRQLAIGCDKHMGDWVEVWLLRDKFFAICRQQYWRNSFHTSFHS